MSRQLHNHQSTPTVFVVDDDAAVRKAVRLMLLSAGHEVETFASAQEFLDAHDPTRPGCLVCDVRMPGIDGMELLQILSDIKTTLPIVMLTAHGDVPMAVSAMQIGAVDFLEKPAAAHVLRRKVADALSRNSQQRANQMELEETRQLIETLTAREREVFMFLVNGKAPRTIATILGTSKNTVRVQRVSIMKKLKADNIADLINKVQDLDLSD
jgi:two-component system, LuxR family, response regulator FixJ